MNPGSMLKTGLAADTSINHGKNAYSQENIKEPCNRSKTERHIRKATEVM